ncbi:ParB/RepB/Spo0J family partition protein [Paludisphaera rhizosphaerae]|uniref:ParB/RepB/Spo0J family partition protein n=1 Tax=Paludisphaera rhizosphaerae TaxID=2711216 RepID=UPI0013EA09A9|nr:ParB/RepB/Spo0J family partition protein [Paludisphaera rhizosphaerae]
MRVLGSEDPAAFVDARKPGESRPWDGSDLEFHELCTMFPPMDGEAFAMLVESVRKHGPTRTVVLHEGKILDGRHAYRAYREVGVEFKVRDWNGEYGTPLDYVLAENLVRRDLTKSQRAALAVEVKRRRNEEYQGNSIANLNREGRIPKACRVVNVDNSTSDARGEVAKALNVSAGYIHAAEKVAEASPETFEQVKRGEVTLQKAREDLGLAKPKKSKPAPAPADSGLVTVNGERKYDEGVERARAAGVIPAGVAVTVEDPGDEAGDVIQAVREEQAEEAAKVDDLTDDEWIARLPLASVLTGVSLTRFRMDALFFRAFEQKMRGSLKAFYGKAAKAYYKGSFRGVVGYGIERLLRVEPPDRWRKCPPTDKGGCDGKGTVPIVGECGLCKGRGYLAR